MAAGPHDASSEPSGSEPNGTKRGCRPWGREGAHRLLTVGLVLGVYVLWVPVRGAWTQHGVLPLLQARGAETVDWQPGAHPAALDAITTIQRRGEGAGQRVAFLRTPGGLVVVVGALVLAAFLAHPGRWIGLLIAGHAFLGGVALALALVWVEAPPWLGTVLNNLRNMAEPALTLGLLTLALTPKLQDASTDGMD